MASISSSVARCPFLLLCSLLLAVCVNAFLPSLYTRLPVSSTTTSHNKEWRRGGESLVRRQSQVQERSPAVSTGHGNNPQDSSSQGEEEGDVKVPLNLLPASEFQSLPWTNSITGEGRETLLYMPFVEEQLRHLHTLGTAKEVPTPPTVAYQRSEKKAAHMGSFSMESEDFRKIRFTYMDGGKSVQVFNSVWYPRHDTDAPLLGIDLLLFGGHRMLAVVDFQPLSHEPEYKAKYIDALTCIKAKYPALCEQISNRYYEDTRWFSENMLFGRFQDISQIQSTLMPAFKEYLHVYTNMVRSSRQKQQGRSSGEEEQVSEEYVKERHRDYDEYNMIRDPAGKLFESYFGKDFAHEMLSFLFESADPSCLVPSVVGEVQQPRQ